jgi:hypothetical protein
MHCPSSLTVYWNHTIIIESLKEKILPMLEEKVENGFLKVLQVKWKKSGMLTSSEVCILVF